MRGWLLKWSSEEEDEVQCGRDELKALLKGEAAYLRIPDLLTLTDAYVLASRISQAAKSGVSGSSIYRSNCVPLYSTYRSPEALEAYFRDSMRLLDSLRELVKPREWPGEALCRTILEAWGHGFQHLRDDLNRPAIFGIPRLW